MEASFFLPQEPMVLTTLCFGAAALVAFLCGACARHEKDEAPAAPPPYEASYPLDTGSLEETPENVRRGRVEDVTPQGRVVLAYEEGAEPGSGAFLYWADTATVHYKYLDTVARKWVIVHDRRDAYVNLFREVLRCAGANPDDRARRRTKERLNRFVWRGRLEDAAPPPPAPAAPPPVALSYKDFKTKNNLS